MSLYTRKGDDGFTSHPHYGRISKSSAEIEVEGKFDEAVVSIGSALVELSHHDALSPLIESVFHVQNRLFSAAFGLYDSSKATAPITQNDIDYLEQHIDTLSERLTPLHSFVMPGGSEAAIRLHCARVAVRSLERACRVSEESSGPLEPLVTSYINRLSDFLFAAARYALFLEEINEADVK